MDKHKYLETVLAQIRCRRARPMIELELADHIDEQISDYIEEGMTLEEAEEEAVRQMGDPVEVGISLGKLHRPKMEWSILAFAVLLGIVGFILQGMIQVVGVNVPNTGTYYPEGGQPFIWKQVVYTVIGIAIMVVIYFQDYTIIAKHAWKLWLAVIALLLLYDMGGKTVNGGGPYINYFMQVLIPVYAAIVYGNIRKGRKGMWRSIWILFATVGVFLVVPGGKQSACALLLVGFILLQFAIYRKWFGEKQKELYLHLWGSLAVGFALFMACIVIGNGGKALAPYQKARLAAFLAPSMNDSYHRINGQIEEMAGREGEEVILAPEIWDSWNTVVQMKSNFLWLYVFRFYGTGMGMFLTVVVFGFLARIVCISLRQKNRLGCAISVGCSTLLFYQVVCYIGMNFGYIPASGVYMPFLSWGGANLCITYAYIGLLLSVCRNRLLVKN